MEVSRYKTLFNEAEDITFVEKSKFIGHAKSVTSEEEAIAFIEKIKKKHRDATHNVPVYIIGSKSEIQRYSDDGEPSGTAGVPVLEMLKKEGFTNLCLVLTRYFGGVKLGTGGLVRAYTQCAKGVIEASGVIEKVLKKSLMLEMSYALHGKIQNVLMVDPLVIIKETMFTEHVQMRVYIPPEYLETFKLNLVELSAGDMGIDEREDLFITLFNGQIMEEQ